MALTRAQRRRIPREKKLKEKHDSGVPYKRDLKNGTQRLKLPSTKNEMMMYLSGRHNDTFRGPENRRERKWWDNFWKMRGRGFTKTPYKGESKKRKVRQEQQSKRWTQKRLNNNRPKARKVEV